MSEHSCPLSELPNISFVTKEQCEVKHQSTKWMFGVLIALIAVFLGLVVLAATISYQASVTASNAVEAVQDAYSNAEEVRTDLQVHKATQIEHEKAILKALEAIRLELSELRREQDILVKAVLESNEIE